MEQLAEVTPITFKATAGERQLLTDLAGAMAAPSLSEVLRVALRTTATAHGFAVQETPRVRGRRVRQKAA